MGIEDIAFRETVSIQLNGDQSVPARRFFEADMFWSVWLSSCIRFGAMSEGRSMCACVAEVGLQGDRQLDLTTSSRRIRILVVEDNDAFRNFISSMLSQQPNLTIIGEEQDGRRAVDTAQALQPDLIFLDIGLPGLNGIAAARKIREVAPSSKIIFLTQESAPEVVEEAFALGAQGYLIKTLAASELLPALESVLRGSRFTSSGLNGHRQMGDTQS